MERVLKLVFSIILDIILIILSAYFTIKARYDFLIVPQNYLIVLNETITYKILITIGLFGLLKVYQRVYRYISVSEMLMLVFGVLSSSILYYGLLVILDYNLPTGFYIIDFIVLFILVSFTRLGYRIIRVLNVWYMDKVDKNGTNTMIIGAGDAGVLLLKDLRLSRKNKYNIKCFIDDNRKKIGKIIEGIEIAGTRDSIIKNVKKYNIQEIIIAIPSLDREKISSIVNICNKTGCSLKILGEESVGMNKNIVKAIREVTYQDLLGRKEIIVEHEGINDFICNKVVLVTGGGGSIGSELCRQIASYNPKELIIFDIYENNAYDIEQELKRKYPSLNLIVLIGSVRDTSKVNDLFKKYRPNIVYHAAAHKHVPLMEDSPCEAIKNNCFGTLNVVKASDMYHVQKFVLISSDKAVRPTNIMGATKRICEMIIQTYDNRSNTSFVAVRFGNVLGSNGSVIPLFLKQIAEGGPVTVTDKKITRFFMTIPEAVSLILEAGLYASGGEIFVLDMGNPVKIYDLAVSLIRLKGLEPNKDIKIEITGLRPGEKLYEEILMNEEGLKNTPNQLIHIGEPIQINEVRFLKRLDRLIVAAFDNDKDIKTKTSMVVDTYHLKKQSKSSSSKVVIESKKVVEV